LREQRSRVSNVDGFGGLAQTFGPPWVGGPDQQRAFEPALHQRDTIETVFECAFEQEQLGSRACRTIAAKRAQVHIEQLGHAGACAMLACTRQAADGRQTVA
jgi:hypothetical protein